jgi:hypothetical protein
MTSSNEAAQLTCLRALQAAFAELGVYNVTKAQLLDRTHPSQAFLVAVRNDANDHNGAVFEHVWQVMVDHYDLLGEVEVPATDFEYKVFDLKQHTSADVLAFIDDCDEPDEVVWFVDWLIGIVEAPAV